MAVPGSEDDPRQFDSDSNTSMQDDCFSDGEDSTTDCSSVSGDDEFPEDDEDNDFPEYHMSADQLRRQEEEKMDAVCAYYRAKEASLDMSTLRTWRYSEKLRENIDQVKARWEKYCVAVRRDVTEAYNDFTPNTLYGLLSWVCDQREGKNGRRTKGIQHLSSLQTFWKNFQLVYKLEAKRKLPQITITRSRDLLPLVATEKGLSIKKTDKATMYVDELQDYLHVLLSTTDMLYLLGYQRIQLNLICQLAGYTGNRPNALTGLQFCDLEISFVRDDVYGYPRLVIDVEPKNTKAHLGKKPSKNFQVPEILYDPSFILSPHVLLIGMLIDVGAFQTPGITSAEEFYKIEVLDGLNEQKMLLRDDLAEKYIFCESEIIGGVAQLCLDRPLSGSSLRYRMRKGGQIWGSEKVTKPYVLRNGQANELNAHPGVSEPLQNQILGHADIRTFTKHYSDRNIIVNTYRLYRRLDIKADSHLKLNSMSRSIDPRRPRRLTVEESRSVDDLPEIREFIKRVEKRAKDNLLREKIERYKREQPLIDIERQRAGLIVDGEVRRALERTEFMTPEHLKLIEAMMTLPGSTLDEDRARRNAAINVVTAYCKFQEGSMCRYRHNKPLEKVTQTLNHTQPASGKPWDSVVRQAVQSVLINKKNGPNKTKTADRPKVCFLCLQNENLALPERVHAYHKGSITKHFERKDLKEFRKSNCHICHVKLDTLAALLNHAETVHGTVTRNPAYISLCNPKQTGAGLSTSLRTNCNDALEELQDSIRGTKEDLEDQLHQVRQIISTADVSIRDMLDSDWVRLATQAKAYQYCCDSETEVSPYATDISEPYAGPAPDVKDTDLSDNSGDERSSSKASCHGARTPKAPPNTGERDAGAESENYMTKSDDVEAMWKRYVTRRTSRSTVANTTEDTANKDKSRNRISLYGRTL
ncbi:hypothetical protein FQN57_006449 [Myotisia sp. PD_48]|nr:hypothetical protein FQN57_006449 [Myotisia sp. PD_48]